jgi:hypothetical protein
MTKTKKSPGINLESTPIYFADQPAALAVGPHVCRITFGVELENGSEYPHPVVTVALPTTALIRLVNDLKKTFDSPSFKKSAISSLEKAARQISGADEPAAKNKLQIERNSIAAK